MTLACDLRHGECIDVLRTLPDSSIDACVTDPPYGIGFMGKRWDYAVPSVDDWREVFRVLKPGAHLLSFWSTRTYHRGVVNIEDAGFEIRDSIAWVYGSGFPKSLDVSKSIDGRKDWAALRALQANVRNARELAGISQSEAARRMGLIPEGESLGGGGFMWFETGMRVPTREQYPRLKAALELGDECDAAFEAAEREVIGEHVGVTPGFVGMRFSADTRNITAPATDAAKEWEGWGTALKPALEPIVVARKPLQGTVAENVQRHGTGAINVDACRIAYAAEGEANAINARCSPNSRARGKEQGDAIGPVGGDDNVSALGRWPANLIHDGSAEVVAMFPDEAGAAAPVTLRNGDKFRTAYGAFAGNTDEEGSTFHGDSGSAARFFYCAKASREDRNEGLQQFTRKPLNWSSGEQSPGAFQSPNTQREVANHHPTVKPTDLMRWLVRLVTPPGGIVLDPFMGSGSTGKACKLEDLRFIGIEREADYVEIARARIEFAKTQTRLFA